MNPARACPADVLKASTAKRNATARPVLLGFRADDRLAFMAIAPGVNAILSDLPLMDALLLDQEDARHEPSEPRTQRVFERSKRPTAAGDAYSAALRARLGWLFVGRTFVAEQFLDPLVPGDT
jgi:hypothetical protein